MNDDKLPPMRTVRFGGTHGGGYCRNYVQATHKPTGTTVTVSHLADGRREGSLAAKQRLALSILKGRLACPTTPTRRVRTYDLTPGMERVHGGGIDTTDVYAVLDRGELLPLPRRDEETRRTPNPLVPPHRRVTHDRPR